MSGTAMARDAVGYVRPLGALPEEGCALVLGGDALAALAAAGVPLVPQATGALLRAVDGEFVEVWSTNGSRPWEKAMDYERVL